MSTELIAIVVAVAASVVLVGLMGSQIVQDVEKAKPPEVLSGVLEDSGSVTEYIYDEDLQICFIRQGRQGQQLKTLTYVPCSEAFRARAAN